MFIQRYDLCFIVGIAVLAGACLNSGIDTPSPASSSTIPSDTSSSSASKQDPGPLRPAPQNPAPTTFRGTEVTWGPIKVTFDQPVDWGNFDRGSATYPGDPWVHVPVGAQVIVESVSATDPIMAMLDPSNPEQNGYHPSNSQYRAGINQTFPFTFVADGNIHSLVIARHFPGSISVPDGSGAVNTHVERYMILTFVPTPPPRGGQAVLRPGYGGDPAAKKMVDMLTLHGERLTTSRALPTGLGNMDFVYDRICRATDYDYFSNLSFGRSNQGQYNSPINYGASKASVRSGLFEAAINSAVSAEARFRYLACLMQMGIDVAHNSIFGNMRYYEGGGQGHGRWLVLALYAIASDDPAILAKAKTWARPRPNPTDSGFADSTEESVHFYFATGELLDGSPINRVLYGDPARYGYDYFCYYNNTCPGQPANDPNYRAPMDPYQLIDAGKKFDTYYSTINTGLTILVNAAEALPDLAELVDPTLIERAELYAAEGVHTLADPYSGQRPSVAAYNGLRYYDGQYDYSLICQALRRWNKPLTGLNCP